MTTDKVLSAEENRQTSRVGTPDDLSGHVLFERFLIERDLLDPSSGGNFAVYIAKDLKHFCRKVVVKAIRQPSAERSGRPNAFQGVCDALMRLDHPNIEWILETGRLFDGRPYVVTTYTSGHSLGEMLSGDRRLVLDRVAHIVESVADALGAAHARGILHCDVTLANIVVTPQEYEAESVRLTNFGSAWPPDSGRSLFEETYWESESPLYTAPELMVEDGRATPASDIYSLAAVAYRMLTGKVPFKATDREEMLELIVKGVQKRPSDLRTDLPADAEAILLSALQYKPLMRPRDVRTFGLELASELRKGSHSGQATRPRKPEVPLIVYADTIREIEVEGAGEVPLVEPKRRLARKAVTIVSDRAIAWSLIILLLAGALSIPIGQTLLDEGEKPAPISSIIQKPADTRLPREIRYSIEGQNVKNPASTASQPMPQNSFVTGGDYRMTFEADSLGNAYVFSEAVDEQGKTFYDVLYPLAKVNSGSAAIEPKQQAKTRPGTFVDGRNTAIVWLVWTAGKHDDLESATRTALEGDGVVRNENEIQKLKHFLERNKNFRLDINNDDANRQTVLKGSGDKIVHRIELEHSQR